jgi:hypothetical protein
MSRPSDWREVFDMGDPTPGDTWEIDGVSRTWDRVADSAEYAETKLRGLLGDEAVATWIGQAGEAFRDRSSELPGQLEKAKNSYRMAAEALGWWSGRLSTHQRDADAALVKGRAAKQDLEDARNQLSSASSSVDAVAGLDILKPFAGGSGPPPSEDDVKAAKGRLDAAKNAESHAQGLVDNAQARLDAARSLAEQAGELRKKDGRTTADKIHDAADAGIKPRSRWQKFKDGVAAAWDVIIKIAKIVVAVLGVVALIIGGPLAWIVFAAALLVLADTLMKYMKGQASMLDVLLSAVDCIPGTKGLTTLSALSKAFKTGGTAAAALHVLGAGKNAIKGMASAVRSLGPATRTAIREFTPSGLMSISARFSRAGGEAGDLTHSLNMFAPDGLPLGARDLPTDGPVGDMLKGWDRTGGLSVEEFSRTYGDGAGGYNWDLVPNDGFLGDRVPMEMNPGEILDRFGKPDGRYLSPPETPFAERGLPPNSLDGTKPDLGYHQYQVEKPFTADVGYIAPAMGQPGGGLQVFVNADHIPDGAGQRVNVQWLLDNDYLSIVEKIR